MFAQLRHVLRDQGLAGLKRRLARIEARAADGGLSDVWGDVGLTYSEWVKKYDTIDEDIRTKIRGHIGRLKNKPLISVVMPVYNPRSKASRPDHSIGEGAALPELGIVYRRRRFDQSEIRRVIERHTSKDLRIKVIYRAENGHISRATNSALDLARGEFVAFLDHDDVLSEHALYWIAAELEAHPQTDIFYSDSDLVGDNNLRHGPYFKPDFSLELMLGHNMVNHLGVYRRSLVEAIGGMRVGLEGSQDYDLFLRVLANLP